MANRLMGNNLPTFDIFLFNGGTACDDRYVAAGVATWGRQLLLLAADMDKSKRHNSQPGLSLLKLTMFQLMSC